MDFKITMINILKNIDNQMNRMWEQMMFFNKDMKIFKSTESNTRIEKKNLILAIKIYFCELSRRLKTEEEMSMNKEISKRIYLHETCQIKTRLNNFFKLKKKKSYRKLTLRKVIKNAWKNKYIITIPFWKTS